MKKAFTLVEILIVVSILGILVAVIIPEFRGHTQKAKESAAKEMLQTLRTQIGLYATRNNGVPPGYFNNNPNDGVQGSRSFCDQLVNVGHYLSKVPKNPFNNLMTFYVLSDEQNFPSATGNFGWLYKPLTKEIRIDWPGVDRSGDTYYDY